MYYDHVGTPGDSVGFRVMVLLSIVSHKKLEAGFRTISAGIPYTLLFRVEAFGFPTFGFLYIAPSIQTLNHKP